MRFVFFGDSVTQGYFGLYPTSDGFDSYLEPEFVYHAHLQPRLAERYGEAVVVNAGIGGDNAHRALERLDMDVLAHRPDAVVVCFGLNDAFFSLEQYEAALDDIFRRLAPHTRVVFLTPNMFNTYIHPDTLPAALTIAEKTMAMQNDGTFDRFVDTARVVCTRWAVPVCDMYAYWKMHYASGVDTTAWLSNQINHPTREVQRIMADSLYPYLAALN